MDHNARRHNNSSGGGTSRVAFGISRPVSVPRAPLGALVSVYPQMATPSWGRTTDGPPWPVEQPVEEPAQQPAQQPAEPLPPARLPPRSPVPSPAPDAAEAAPRQRHSGNDPSSARCAPAPD